MPPASFYLFSAKLSKAGLVADLTQIKNHKTREQARLHGTPVPAGFRFEGPMLIGSNKPPEKSYDILVDDIVSEKLAQVIRSVAGDSVQLIPFEIAPHPKAKYPLPGPYYWVNMPRIDCLTYTYSEEDSPTQTPTALLNNTIPKTYKKIAHISIDHKKVEGCHLFNANGKILNSFMSRHFKDVCKSAKVVGLVNYGDEDYLNNIKRHSENDHCKIYGQFTDH